MVTSEDKESDIGSDSEPGMDSEDEMPDALPEFMDFNMPVDEEIIGDVVSEDGSSATKHVTKLDMVQMNVVSVIDDILASSTRATEQLPDSETSELSAFNSSMSEIRRCTTTLNHSMLAQVSVQ